MAIVKDRGNPQSQIEPHLDRNPDAPFQRKRVLTVGGALVPKGRSVEINASASGNATFVLPDGSTTTEPIGVGYQTYPFAIVGVQSSTATAVYTNEY